MLWLKGFRPSGSNHRFCIWKGRKQCFLELDEVGPLLLALVLSPCCGAAGQFRISMDVDKSYSTPLLRNTGMHATDSVKTVDMEQMLSTKSWKLPVPGSSLPISSKEEMNLLLDAWQYNQVFFFGRYAKEQCVRIMMNVLMCYSWR